MKLALAAIVLALSCQAQAGEILRLKATGSFRPMGVSAPFQDGLFLVQWKNSIHEAEKAKLASLGMQLISYVPDDAFLVKASAAAALEAQKLSYIRTVVAYEPSMKVEPELTQHGLFSFDDRLMATIQVVKGSDASTLKKILPAAKEVEEGLWVSEASVGDLWSVASLANVVWVERFLAFRSMDMDLGVSGFAPGAPTGFESGTKMMNAPEAYAAGINGAGELVGFADTGLDTGVMETLLPDFQGQVKSAFAVGLGGKSWGDPMNHGTHVAGSIAGAGVSSNGNIRGTAFGAKLVAQGMWSDIMNNIVPPTITKLFEGAYKEGVRIHSNSWGAPGSNGRYDSWANLTDSFMFDKQDFLPVFAAGNDGADLNKDGVVDEGTVSSPGSSKNVLTVGASKNFLTEGGIQRPMKQLRDGNNKWGVEPIASSFLSEDGRGMAAFSSRGPTADGRIKPEIVAPGTNIVSARSHHPKAKPEDSWGIYDDNYLYMGGTSMATPLTSGAAALARQYIRTKTGADFISAALVKALLTNTAYDLYPGQFGERAQGQEQPTRRPNNHEGWGRVDLANMVNSSISLVDERSGVATGQQFSKTVVAGSSPIRITMAYTDAPGATNATKTLVNDIDLSVIAPDGTELFPNGGRGKDSVNVMEGIDILNPMAGSYQILVKGANVPQGKSGKQPFALVIQGAR